MNNPLQLILAYITLLSMAVAQESSYFLRLDDQIKMEVYMEEDLLTAAQIGKSGEISFPLIGSVKLQGLTVKEAENKIKDLYGKDYLVNPRVSLSVEDYAEKWVIVSGDVKRPGTINFPKEGLLDLGAAIAQAGGLGEDADRSKIIIRTIKGELKTASMDKHSTHTLTHGDSVTIRRLSLSKSIVTVAGNVNSPGAIDYPKEGNLNVLIAIALAGDFSEKANKNSVVVSRDGRQIGIDLSSTSSSSGKNFSLRPGDFVLVKENTLKSSTVTIAGNVNKPGTVSFPKQGGLDIVTAIALAGDFTRIANKKEVAVRRDGGQAIISIKDIQAGKRSMFYLKPGDIVLVKESRF
ncbi:MAG: SLBB domain-containing protein [Patiriisocius sp.]|uniref:SLBB domain-containing protein n=1 Tax=Patiriisocius sp. TaxID=2822396 RepID=UPI003EF16FBA